MTSKITNQNNTMSGVGGGLVAPTKKKDSAKSEQVQSLQNPLLGENPNAVSSNKKFPSEGYDVNLSPHAKQMAEARAKAYEIAKNTPEVREDRVAELKKKIQSGEYKVDSTKVADGMMREAFMQALTENDELN